MPAKPQVNEVPLGLYGFKFQDKPKSFGERWRAFCFRHEWIITLLVILALMTAFIGIVTAATAYYAPEINAWAKAHGAPFRIQEAR